MDKKHPLLVGLLTSSSTDIKFTNKRGRPTTEKAIIFGPQPMSMVAQMLLKMKKEKLIHNDTDYCSTSNVKVESICSMDESLEPVEHTEANDVITCTICSHRSNNTEEHRNHLKVHKQYACDYPNCLYSCKLSTNLTKHKRIHTREKPYLCDRCSFRSNFINSLKTHKRIHTTERPYQCKYCIYKCNSSSNLKKHYFHRHPDDSMGS